MKTIFMLMVLLAGFCSGGVGQPPVGCWTFDNNNGLDDCGMPKVNALTINAVQTTDRHGNPNSAYLFDKTLSNYISLGDNFDPIFSKVNTKFAWAFWIKPNSKLDNNLIISKYSFNDCGENQRTFFIGINKERVGFAFYESLDGMKTALIVTDNIAGNILINDTSKWYHIVVNYDGSVSSQTGIERVEIYIDGQPQGLKVEVNPGGNIDSLENGTAHLGIGGALKSDGTPCTNNSFFDGKIDDVCLFNDVIDSVRVNSLYLGNKTSTNSFIDQLLSEIAIYPNPTNSIVRITTDQIIVTQVAITGLWGRTYGTHQIPQNREINLSSLPRGIYFLSLWSHSGYLGAKKITKY